MDKVLFINSCIKNEKESRTYKLCTSFINSYQRSHPSDIIDTIVLKDIELNYLNEKAILHRNKLIKNSELGDITFKLANTFKTYDKIIIGAPMYNMSIPALLKVYIENICVMSLTFDYVNKQQVGLCKAKKLMYLTSRGDDFSLPPLVNSECDIPYMKAITKMLGIKQFDSFALNNTDNPTINLQEKLEEAKQTLNIIAGEW